MSLADAIPEDDLLLAQLTTKKLAKMMHGLMSVGTAALEMVAPQAFLADRGKMPLGFLDVLRSIGVKPGHADKLELLRGPVRVLSDLASRFYDHFMDLTRWRTMSDTEVQTAVACLGECYGHFCQSLGGLSALLGLDVNYSEQVEQDRNLLEAVFQTLLAH